MARRSSMGLWIGLGVGGAAVLGLGAATAFAVSRRRDDELPGGSTGSGAGSGKPADPRAADAAFAATTAAAATTAVAAWPATAPYVGASTPLVVAAWQAQPPSARAGIFSPEVAAAAQVAAPVAAGAATTPSPAPASTGTAGRGRQEALAGWVFGAAPKFAKKGPGAVFKWTVDRFVKELKKAMANLRGQFCGNANKVYKKLKDAGAAVPKQSKWDDLSCDQKIAFVAALGPQGVAMLVAGTLVAGFARDAVGEFKKFGGKASDAVADLSRKLGVKVPEINVSVPKAPKLFGLDDHECPGCTGRGEPLPGANLPGTTFVTAAGHPPRPHPANFRTRDVSPVKFGVV